jgi:hypothetical protein
MVSCCTEFEKHCQKTEEGFWISRSYHLLPYEVRMTLLWYQIAGQPGAALRINFCPWCGCDLKSTAKALEESDG